MSCKENGVESDKMIKAKAKATELNKNRTHSFSYYFDPDKNITVVEGGFFIDNKEYPGKIIFTQNQSILLKPNPDQCIIFPKNQVIYGFFPPIAIMQHDYDNLSINISLLEKNRAGFPTRYEAYVFDSNQKSIVEISKIETHKFQKSLFEIPKDAKCVDYENLIKI